MNFYQHHIGDYMKDTAHLSATEDGIYRRLLDAYYNRELPLPLDHRMCHKIARAQSKQERDAVDLVLGEFFVREDDGWHQKRCDDEIAKYHVKQDKARQSAHARWGESHSEGNANASANAMRTHSEGNATRARPHYPVTSKPPTSPIGEVSPPCDAKASKTTFRAWLARVKESGEKAISDYNPVFAYCEKAGIPTEFVELAWDKFRRRYLEDANARGKRYIDWRRVFLNAVEDNWFKLWCFRDDVACLTTVGQQAKLAARGAA